MILNERLRPQATVRQRPAAENPVSRSRSWFFGALAVLLAATAATAIRELRDPAAFPIRRVTVDGDFRYLAPAQLRKIVSSAVNGGFFHVDVQRVREALLDEPWVREATVQRLWPDTLHVSIVEQHPVAYWGEHALLNDVGDLFAPAQASFPTGLVRLDGPVGAELDTLAIWRDARARLDLLGLAIAAVSVSERRALTLRLADGAILVLGRDRIVERLERFAAAYEKLLRDNWQRIAVVDLRYTNGFSIRERAADPPGGRVDPGSDRARKASPRQ